TLAKEAQAKKVPLFTVDYDGEPRSALGYMFLAPLALVQKLGLVSDKSGQVAEALSSLEGMAASLAPSVPSARNPAKTLAKDLHGRIAVVYGAGYFGAVARRWKTQINENSKSWAFWETLPELHHNSVVGYSLPREMANLGLVVMVQASGLHPQVVKRYQITRELLDQQKTPHRTVEGRGSSPLSQMLTAIHLGDYVSYYLALLNNVDPAPVPTITYIKSHL
ncbi:MAG: SIS domain-containing protein, partial [Chloroflexota bacterium]|nr:SIS domain-containing protein [Chloroflexota bacterium]